MKKIKHRERERERGITPSLNSFISLNLNKTKPMNASYVNRNKHLHKTKALIKISFVEYTPICPKQNSFNTSNSFNQKITLKHQNPIQLFLNTHIYVWVQWYFVKLDHWFPRTTSFRFRSGDVITKPKPNKKERKPYILHKWIPLSYRFLKKRRKQKKLFCRRS